MHVPSRHGPWPRGPARARPGAAVLIAALGGLAGMAALAPAVIAAGASSVSFAEAFDRARLVVVATVDAAPPSAPGYRLTVEQVVKGPDTSVLTFPAEATALPLVPASRIVLLAMDPASLDFRGTWALAVGADGAIEADGFSDAPPTVDALLATYGAGSTAPSLSSAPAATSPAPPTSAGPDAGVGSTGDGPPTSLAVVAIAAAVLAAGVVLVAVLRARTDRHER